MAFVPAIIKKSSINTIQSNIVLIMRNQTRLILRSIAFFFCTYKKAGGMRQTNIAWLLSMRSYNVKIAYTLSCHGIG